METNTIETGIDSSKTTVISPEILLKQWQGHRRLTRKVIEAFPEEKLFTYSIGGLRPFSELAMEMIRMGAPGIRGVVMDKWPTFEQVEQEFKSPSTRKQLLELWDNATDDINALWPQIPPQRFQEVVRFFSQYEGPVYWSILYLIDNEIHHRAQGYVYLRSLGITPPFFWDRA